MQISKLLGERFKEKPAEATLISHTYLLRGGYIRQVANGIYSMLLPAKRVATKIEKIIREEMDNIDGQEVLLPVVLPAELWKESGRFDSVGSELMRMKDRAGHDMVLGMTHEEAVVHLARTEAMSYAKYPFMLYQIQTKFRDEPRSRGGLIRVREFTMKDAYSFHTTTEDLEAYYEKVLQAYHRIFQRAGLSQVIAVGSDTGMMGGKKAHEFMFLTEVGEDTLVLCNHCGYQDNMEVAVSTPHHSPAEESAVEEVHTPGVKDIESLSAFFGVSADKFLKAAVFLNESTKKPVVVFTRGDKQVNEAKLRKAIKANIFPMTEWDGSSLVMGYIGPYGLDSTGMEVVFDLSLEGETNLISGANKENTHLKGISMERDIRPSAYVDVAKANEGEACAHCGGGLSISRGIEVGNIFQLGTKYSEGMNMTYTDADGQKKHPIMGCYGIGVGRLLACAIEEHHDDYGPIWPLSIAPWHIHICTLNNTNEAVSETGFRLYEALKKKYEVLLDDRNVAAGIQFADADLLGVPIRIIVSARNLEKGEVELVTRDKKVKKFVPLSEVEEEIARLVEVERG